MKSVVEFETQIADFYQAPYAVATDCCTHAIELCLRYLKIKETSCPTHTYISIPFTFEKLGIDWKFRDEQWYDYYYLGNTPIVDAAVYWKQGGYIDDTFMCLSFQYRKHLSLGRGGAILVSNLNSYTDLKKMSYDGRMPDIPWAEQDIDILGYHYYMTPETAELGIKKINQIRELIPRQWSYNDYPELSKMQVFRNV